MPCSAILRMSCWEGLERNDSSLCWADGQLAWHINTDQPEVTTNNAERKSTTQASIGNVF